VEIVDFAQAEVVAPKSLFLGIAFVKLHCSFALDVLCNLNFPALSNAADLPLSLF
jgi:hypothetical protein